MAESEKFVVYLDYIGPSVRDRFVAEVSLWTTVAQLKAQLKQKYAIPHNIKIYIVPPEKRTTPKVMGDSDTMCYHDITSETKLLVSDRHECTLDITLMLPVHNQGANQQSIDVREDETVEEAIALLKRKFTVTKKVSIGIDEMGQELYSCMKPLLQYEWLLTTIDGNVLPLKKTVKQCGLLRNRKLYCKFVPREGEQS